VGADVHHRGTELNTALHRAVHCYDEQRAVEIAQLLLAEGADVRAMNVEGQTPLHHACHAACVNVLLDAGANLEALDRFARTPIYVAATDWPRRAEVVLRMADRGADLVNTGVVPGFVEGVVKRLRAERSSGGPADHGCQVVKGPAPAHVEERGVGLAAWTRHC